MTIVLPSCPAKRSGESVRPDLWRGCASLWAPCISRFSGGSTFSGRLCGIEDLGYCKSGIRRAGNGNLGVGQYGSSLIMPGTGGGWIDNSASLTNYSFVQNTAVFTLMALVRSDAVGTFKVIMDNIQGSTVNSGFLLWQANTGLINYSITRSSAGNSVVAGAASANTAFVAGRWYHVVVTSDGSFGRIYINGRKASTDAAVSTLSTGSGTLSLGIGCYGGGLQTNPWNGQIGYLGIWNRAMHAGEIKALGTDPLLLFRKKESIFSQSIPVVVPPSSNSYIIIQRRRRIM